MTQNLPPEIQKQKEELAKKNKEQDKKQEHALENFRKPELLDLIYGELDKFHKEDRAEKLFAFLMSRTAFLPNAEDHKSLSLRGESSTGKDNLIKVIEMFSPPGSCLVLTSATKATMEDDIATHKIIAYSEVNKDRENGANQQLVETIKQLTEGGIHAIKKDNQTGFRSVKNSIQEQKTVLYATTEERVDKEMDTRFTVVPIFGHPDKVKIVNDNTLLEGAGKIRQRDPGQNWLTVGQSYLVNDKDVVFPHLEKLVPSKNFFDTSNPRSMRDLKRLRALAKAIAWIHQEQRAKVELDGQMYILGHPDDFLNALVLSAQFFNLSYLEIDARTLKLLDAIKCQGDEAIDRETLQNLTGIRSKNTIDRYARILADAGLVERTIDTTKNNRVVYRGVSSGVKKGVKWVSRLSGIRDAFADFGFKEWLDKHSSSILFDTLDRQLTGDLTPYYMPVNDVGELRVSKILGDILKISFQASVQDFDTLNFDT